MPDTNTAVEMRSAKKRLSASTSSAMPMAYPPAREREPIQKQHHYGVDREVMIVKKAHPLSLLISRVSMVP